MNKRHHFIVSTIIFLCPILTSFLFIFVKLHNSTSDNNHITTIDKNITPVLTKYKISENLIQYDSINLIVQNNKYGQELESNFQGVQLSEEDKKKEADNIKKEAYEYYDLGNKYASEKEYRKAIENYDLAIKNNFALLGEAYFKRANAYYNKGMFDKAIEDYHKVLSYNIASKAVIFNSIANAYFLNQEYSNAYEYYREAIESDKTFISAWYNLGNINIKLNNHDEAIANFNFALELSPSDSFKEKYLANLHYARGVEFFNQKQYGNARKDFEEVIKLKPEFTNAYIDLGNTYIRLKRPEDAISVFTEVINSNPQNIVALNNRAYAYSLMGENTRAVADIERIKIINQAAE